MAYDPSNNPYVPGDPYAYDLKWVIQQIKGWKDPADSADRAKASEDAAKVSELNSEAWAVGTKDGVPVDPAEPQHDNDSKFWAGEAAEKAGEAADSAAEAKDYADNIADPVSGIVTAWLDDHITQPTTPAIDTSLTIAGAAADAKAAGDRIRALEFNETQNEIKHKVNIEMVLNEYYNSADGNIEPSASYNRSKYLISCPEFTIISCDELSDNSYLNACCYDADKVFIGNARIRETNVTSTMSQIGITPKGTAYIGITAVNTLPAPLNINLVFGFDKTQISYPFPDNNKEYLIFNTAEYNASYRITASVNNKVALIPAGNFDTVFVSDNINRGVIYYDDTLTAAEATYTAVTPYGRLYTIPSTAVVIGVVLPITNLDIDGVISSYAAFNTADNKISGKKILAIGDSITYIDGRVVAASGDTGYSFGYQKWLRKKGAIVDSAGYSGYAYAHNVENTSIYDEIVTNSYDVTGYDYIILFGGANDVRLSVPIGTASSDYDSPNVNPDNFIGAIGGIIDYIRTNNPTAKIILMTILPSQDNSRKFNKAINYRNAILDNAIFWSVADIDIFKLINVTSKNNFSLCFYDGTHPNSRGMQRIGEIMAEHIINVI